mmetsp:Transcript_55076/g.112591  ORF Transcript_55076/g.112591 Transcript_55076/m.112591 type:complete len:201 (-) Transcript_55076:176-778(-)
MSLTPSNSKGASIASLSFDKPTLGSSTLVIVGKLGPKISASKIPTLPPNFAMLYARLTATVDFPTPPLQLDTAMILFTCFSPGHPWDLFAPAKDPEPFCCAVSVNLTSVTHGNFFTYISPSLLKSSLTGHAGVVSSRSNDTVPPEICKFLTKPRETISCPRSGSMMFANCVNTSVSLPAEPPENLRLSEGSSVLRLVLTR